MTTPTKRQDVTSRITNARQTITLLRSQLEAGMVEYDFWMARLSDLGDLLETVAEERAAGDQQQRLAALYEVSSALGSSLDVDEVLNQVMDAIISLTGAERGFLMLLDEGGELDVQVARNINQETLSEADFAFSRSVVSMVAQEGEQIVTTNAAEDPRFAAKASVVAHNLRSIMCVPLRARGKIIGVVYVDNRIRSGVFDESDLEMLGAFAAQAAVAIENARLFTTTDEALEARVMELSMMQEIDRQLNETLDFGKVMQLTVDWAVRVTGADNGAIGLIDLEAGITQVIAEVGAAPAHVEALLAASGSPEEEPGSMTVPVQREGHIIGVIALDRNDERPFTREAYDFVVRLADHAAIAIENARLYAQVREADKAKTDFISMVTHELRLPMTAIKGYADMLSEADNLSNKQHRYTRVIHNNVNRMQMLVSDLSDIARIESGRLRLNLRDDVSLPTRLEQTLVALQAQIDARGHETVVDVPHDLPTLHTDPGRLEQILTNLISNAYKYTPDGGTITVSARDEGDFVRVTVQDTGVGMSEEELSQLFTMFWRSENHHVRDQQGTGLGLVITRNLIHVQGGELTVESEVGHGTIFAFTLPVTGSPAVPATDE